MWKQASVVLLAGLASARLGSLLRCQARHLPNESGGEAFRNDVRLAC
jgi:hypothetical protein